jgi:hypothetical protein
MEVHRLDVGSSRDVDRYINFPFELYRGHPLWVPPLVTSARAQLDPARNPFFAHSEAAFFLVLRGEEVAGRIAVLDNRRYNDYRGERTALFWDYDLVDDRAVSEALFDAAFDWARARGLEMMWGPKGFSALDGRGALVEGFDHRPAMGILYNYPYYGQLIEDAGFTKDIDLYSYHIDRTFELPGRVLELAERIKRRRGFRAARIRSKSDLRAYVPSVAAAYNEAFRELAGFVPITKAEAAEVGDRILAVGDPTMIKVLLKGEDVVGFIIAYPDLSAALQRCRGRIWPTGWVHLALEARRTQWVNFNGLAILEGYRGLGGNAVLLAEIYDTLADRTQFQHADLVQVQDANERMQREMHALGVVPYKRHRVYTRSLL